MTRTLFQEYRHYVLSSVCSMLAYSFYILADTYFIALGIGTKGLAALNVALPLFNLLSALGYMTGIGMSAYYTMQKAQHKQKESQHVFSYAIELITLLSILFFIIGLFFSSQVTHLLGANQEIFHYTQTYISYLLCFSGLFLFNYVLNHFVKNDGNPKLAMLAMLIGSFVNIAFDYLFIIEWSMGMRGAIFATLFAPTIGILILLTHFIKYPIKICFVSLKSSVIKPIIKIGLPSFISEICVGIMMFVNNILLLSIQGVQGVAAYGVIANIYLIVVCLFNGISMGTQPLLSRFIALKDYHKLKKVKEYTYKVLLVLSVVVLVILLEKSDLIIELFNHEGNIQMHQIASQGLKLYFLGEDFGQNDTINEYCTLFANPLISRHFRLEWV